MYDFEHKELLRPRDIRSIRPFLRVWRRIVMPGKVTMVTNRTVAAVSLWLSLGAAAGGAHADTVIYTENSLYRPIVVSESFGTRCLRFNRHSNSEQSCISLKNPDSLVFDCNKMMLGALYLRPNPRRVLMIGLGGGTLVSALSRVVPESEIDVVEIDPSIVRVAKEYFNFRPSPKVRVTVSDGRVFVKRALSRGEKYDLIMLDAFDQRYIPPHLLTKQFLNEVKKILTADGVLAANTFYFSDRYDDESVTYESVYGSFFNLRKALKNPRVIIARQNGLPPREVLAKNSKALEEKMLPVGVEASWLLPLFSTEPDWDANGQVLTDQFSPY